MGLFTDEERAHGNRLTNTLLVVVVVVVTIGGFLTWEGYKGRQAREQAYEGTLVEKERARKWWRGFRQPGEMEYRYYNHYWIIETSGGERLRVEVPHTRYGRTDVGVPVRKDEGERYPVVDTPEAQRGRELSEEIEGQVWDALGL